jgi:hypothetical protein
VKHKSALWCLAYPLILTNPVFKKLSKFLVCLIVTQGTNCWMFGLYDSCRPTIQWWWCTSLRYSVTLIMAKGKYSTNPESILYIIYSVILIHVETPFKLKNSPFMYNRCAGWKALTTVPSPAVTTRAMSGWHWLTFFKNRSYTKSPTPGWNKKFGVVRRSPNTLPNVYFCPTLLKTNYHDNS